MRFVSALLLVTATACAAQHPGATTPGHHAAGPRILELIPADTPYVLASLSPLPKDYFESAGRTLRRTLPRLDAMAELAFAKNHPGARLALATVRNLAEHYSPTGLPQIGLGTDMRFALYGIGLVPALRVSVDDPARLIAFFDEQERAAGFKLERGRRGAHEYRLGRIDEIGVTVVLAVMEDRKELVLSFTPTAVVDETVAVLLDGPGGPGSGLLDAGGLEKLRDEYHFDGAGVGYVSFERLVHALTDDKGFSRRALAALGVSLPTLPPVCTRELSEMAAGAPRLVIGVDSVKGSRTSGRVTLELGKEITLALGALRVAVPGVGRPLGDNILTFGGGIDVSRAITFARIKLAMMKAHPYQCELLAPLNELVDDADRALATPLPSWAKDVRGVYVELKDVQQVPPDVKGLVVLSASDPIRLLDLAKRFYPALGNVQIPSDGTPVALPGYLPISLPTFLAVRGTTLGFAVGGGMDGELVKTMSTPVGKDVPFFVMGLDEQKLTKVTRLLRGLFGGGDDDGPPSAMRVEMSVGVSDHGLTLWFASEE